MEASHAEWSLPARRKTAGFHEEMVKFSRCISAILQHSKPCALDQIRIFGDRWSQLNIGLPNYKLRVVGQGFGQGREILFGQGGPEYMSLPRVTFSGVSCSSCQLRQCEG
jgi:hypothetical protein